MDPHDESSEDENARLKTVQNWMQYIDGHKRLNDDIEFINKEKTKNSSLFFRVPSKPLNIGLFKRKPGKGRKSVASMKLFKPFTPQMGQIRQILKDTAQKSPFYQLPSQNEINKMLATVGSKNIKLGGSQMGGKTRIRVYDYRNQQRMTGQPQMRRRRISQVSVMNI